MIGHLLDGLGGNPGELWIARGCEPFIVGVHECGIEKMAEHCHCKVAVQLLDEQKVAEVLRVTKVGETILVTALAFDLAGIAVQQPSLTDEVELRITEGGILIEAVRTPRAGWEEAAKRQRENGEDGLLDDPTPTAFDDEGWAW